MIQTRRLRKLGRAILPLGMGTVSLVVLLTTSTVPSAQNPAAPENGEVLSSPPAVNSQAALTTPKPPSEPKKSHLEQTKSDAAELSALAEQLRDELNKMNVNVLSLDVIEKTKKVEELAKKIKEETNGH